MQITFERDDPRSNLELVSFVRVSPPHRRLLVALLADVGRKLFSFSFRLDSSAAEHRVFEVVLRHGDWLLAGNVAFGVEVPALLASRQRRSRDDTIDGRSFVILRAQRAIAQATGHTRCLVRPVL